jgi:Na+/H+ antiporter NhaA
MAHSHDYVGKALQGMGFVAALTSSVSLGVVIGLVLGKQLGITLASWLAIRLGWTDRPSGVGFRFSTCEITHPDDLGFEQPSLASLDG